MIRLLNIITRSYSTPSPCFKDHVSRTRNIGIIAHVDAGKTTTTERMLYVAGYTQRIGHVDHGSTVTDFLPQEQERGITIQSAAITFNWRGTPSPTKINLIDTPGHVDFTFEVERSLRVLDGAVIVLDGVEGVQAQSHTVWTQANQYSIPRVIFINKLDRAGASFTNAMHSITTKLKSWGTPVPIQIPVFIDNHMATGSGLSGVIDTIEGNLLTWSIDGLQMDSKPITDCSPYYAQWIQARDALIDSLSQVSDHVLEAAIDDHTNIPQRLIYDALRLGTIDGSIVPVLVGSSFRNIAVQPLLDAIDRFLPSPTDRPPVSARLYSNPSNEVMVRLEDQQICILAFKVVFHTKRGYMTYIRVYSGSLQNKQQLLNTTTNTKERVNKILLMYASDSEEIETLSAGNIGVLLGLKNTRTGDTLSSVTSGALVLKGMSVPPPVFTCSIEPVSTSQAKEVDLAFDHLTREDPSVTIHEDKDTGEVLVGGQGELHLEIIKDRLIREYRLDVRMGPMQIAYRETISSSASLSDTYVREGASGSESVRVPISITVEPLPYASTFIPIHSDSKIEVSAPHLSPESEHCVRTAIESVLSSGPLHRSPVANIRVEVSQLILPPAEGNGVSAASMALSSVHWLLVKAIKAANPVLIEPMVRLSVVVPEVQHVGSILRDLNRRRARILHVGSSNHSNDQSSTQVIDAEVPLKQLIGYSSAVRKVSAGSGVFTISIEGYNAVENQ